MSISRFTIESEPIMSRCPCIVITLGDPCGISPELLLRSLRAINRWASVIVVGAKAGVDLLDVVPERKVHWRWGKAALPAPEVPGASIYGLWTSDSPDWRKSESSLLGYATWIDPTPSVTVQDLALGEASAASGRCAVEGVRIGASLVMSGKADALVTLPLSKSAAHQAGFNIPGHTEYLQELAGSPITRMAFVSPSLSVVLHTVHQSLKSVVDELTADAVAETLIFSADRFMQLTGKLDLKVALCALNPHAGESGAFGGEETLLCDALVQAEASFMEFSTGASPSPFAHVASPFDPGPIPEGWDIFPAKTPSFSMLGGQRDIEVISRGASPEKPPTHPSPLFFGPLPSDTLFQRAAKGEFDLVVALYHDQGLIPIKVLEPSRAVNLTLGLPFIRTSPDHGTAFDKAGRWQADPTNFLEATALAIRLAGRAKHEPWKADVPHAGSGQ
jgi:4-hydroxy-L-threonine phosphate dehydrogenase PdxA